ncbi:Fc receptor-like protein 3 isoform X4 [Sebastes umbrosus]|uniref:Fc receptor-like protein 3 isoform X4 n=1 Tax=Sebastes umbrosus TaxID=72105 RepID=UPI00189E21AB|nr:Fc receptor-like protein 3 isoform X4 [Sebastes umbrosus]
MNTALLFLWVSVVSVSLSVCQPSVHSRASVTVNPSSSQHFEYDKVTVSCEQLGSDWTVWRYTTDRLELSQCGSDWGDQTSSGCEIKTIKLSDAGVYWCQSKHRDSSNAVIITVMGGPVILQSPLLPVMEGDDITLRCRNKTPSSLPADFYKDGAVIGTEPLGHMAIHHVSRSNKVAYKCNIGGRESLPSWLLMKDDSDPPTLKASPDSSQVFEYKNLSLSCGDNNSFDGWKIVRSRTTATNTGGKKSTCGEEWGTGTSTSCHLDTLKQTDSATYWCESPAKQRSNCLNITVHDGPVILQSPVLPVRLGDNVTLHCRTKTSSNLPAAFYKDGALIGTEPAGHMTLHHVSTSDEGLYKCLISSDESPPSSLFVRDPNSRSSSTAVSTQLSLRVMLHLVVIFPYFVSTVLLVSVYRHPPAGRNPPVSMTTSPRGEDDEGSDQPYDEVTTEHHF